MENVETTNVQDLIISIGASAANSAAHDPMIAENRKSAVLEFIAYKLPHYAEALGMDSLTILSAWEKQRGNLLEINFYQEYMIPQLDGTFIFDTKADFNLKFPSHTAICPNCKGETTDFYKCNSGKIMTNRACQFISSPIMGINDYCIRVMIKELFSDFPVPQQIFKPIELISPPDQNDGPAMKKMV